MKYDKLNKTTPYYDWHFKDYLTQEHVVLDGLDCDQTLENTYWVMQDFMVAIQNNDEKKLSIYFIQNKLLVNKCILSSTTHHCGIPRQRWSGTPIPKR